MEEMSEYQIHCGIVSQLKKKNNPFKDIIKRMNHPASGEKRNEKTAAKLKKMGVIEGVPDLHLPFPKKPYHGFYMEIKKPKGKLSKKQKDYIQYLISVGYAVKIARSIGEGKDAVMKYLLGEHNNDSII